VLLIVIPIAPMPEYELPDWTRDTVRYDIMAVSGISLGLRKPNGEQVIVLRRMDHAAYEERQAQRYLEALAVVRELADRAL
jgi:hypothetical protein